jgi:hypothetical protein
MSIWTLVDCFPPHLTNPNGLEKGNISYSYSGKDEVDESFDL